ncbi:MAG: hypothetical protein ACRD40_10485 [Candidatus Acidiferrales bacterium]
MSTQTIYLRMRAAKDVKNSWQPSDSGDWQYVQVVGSTERGKRPAWQLKAEEDAKNR